MVNGTEREEEEEGEKRIKQGRWKEGRAQNEGENVK